MSAPRLGIALNQKGYSYNLYNGVRPPTHQVSSKNGYYGGLAHGVRRKTNNTQYEPKGQESREGTDEI